MVMTDNVHLVHINPPSLILSLGSVCWATGENWSNESYGDTAYAYTPARGVATTKSSGGSWPTMFTSFTVTHQDSFSNMSLSAGQLLGENRPHDPPTIEPEVWQQPRAHVMVVGLQCSPRSQ